MIEQEYTGIRSPMVSILLTLGMVLLGFQLVGPMLGMIIAYPFYPGTPFEFTEAMKAPFSHPEFKNTLLIMQGTGTFVGMVVLPFLFLRKQSRQLGDLFDSRVHIGPIIMVVAIVIIFMGINSIIVEWNRGLHFPGDGWMREIEQRLEEGTKFLTKFETTADLLAAIIVIAILPAIGEEIVFRGMIQNDFYRATRNIHVAIWVSAALFSAIHVQFFGFVPRMLLGALFGYLYYWSGNLWLPVIAHFINNGVTVVALYLYQKGHIQLDLESSESASLPAAALSLTGTILLLYSYKNFFNHNPKSDIPD